MEKYFKGEELELVLTHGRMVADLACKVGRNLGLNDDEIKFLYEAAMLHDIGICKVNAPGIGMHGQAPYITHGVIGRKILEEEGLPHHALICERHIGVGLTTEDIIAQKLPLPERDMTPQNLYEEIICFADLFYSKTPGKLESRKSVEQVREKLSAFGKHKVEIFDEWMKRFGKDLFED
jgi:uncharacterized protein